MITKAIIEKVNVGGNTAKVRIPILNKQKGVAGATNTDDLYDATVCCMPNFSLTLRPGDVVYVDFEDNYASKPVIIGFLSNSDLSQNTGTTASVDSLSVNTYAELPQETTIGDITYDELSNLRGVNQNISSLNQEIDQLNKISTDIVRASSGGTFQKPIYVPDIIGSDVGGTVVNKKYVNEYVKKYVLFSSANVKLYRIESISGSTSRIEITTKFVYINNGFLILGYTMDSLLSDYYIQWDPALEVLKDKTLQPISGVPTSENLTSGEFCISVIKTIQPDQDNYGFNISANVVSGSPSSYQFDVAIVFAII